MTHPDDDLIADILGGDRLLSTDEVAALMRVDPKTVSRWAFAGRFPDRPDGRPGAMHTLAGAEWRFWESVVRGLLDGTLTPREVS